MYSKSRPVHSYEIKTVISRPSLLSIASYLPFARSPFFYRPFLPLLVTSRFAPILILSLILCNALAFRAFSVCFKALVKKISNNFYNLILRDLTQVWDRRFCPPLTVRFITSHFYPFFARDSQSSEWIFILSSRYIPPRFYSRISPRCFFYCISARRVTYHSHSAFNAKYDRDRLDFIPVIQKSRSRIKSQTAACKR